jgi:opacity protein-like surface antigen
MTRTLKHLLAGAAMFAAALPLAANAQSMHESPHFYAGLDALVWDSELNNAPSYDAVGGRLRLGMAFHPMVAFEVHAGTGGSDTQSGVEQKLNHVVGVFARATLPIADDVRLYGLVGGAEVSVQLESATNRMDVHESGFAYGAGAEINVFDQMNFYVEGTRYLDKEALAFETLGAGLRYQF